MKYLKTYEEIDQTTYKKYMLFKSSENIYFILEVDKFFNREDYYGDEEEGETIVQEFISTKKKYKYIMSLDKLEKVGRYHYFNFQPLRDDKSIIYQSDKLKNVLDVIPILKQQPKFNL